MKRTTVVLRTLRYFLRSHFGLALGVAVATAVVVGALVIGDCMRGSLRALALQRLANIVYVLQSRHYFDPQFLDQLQIESVDAALSAAPFIHLSNCAAEHRGSTEAASSVSTDSVSSVTNDDKWRSASKVQLYAIDHRFLEGLVSESSPSITEAPGLDEIFVNESLARELGVKVGDEITLRFGHTSGVPADNPLGRRDRGSINLPRQRVVKVVSDLRFGGLNFRITQETSLNVFANLTSLQDLLEIPGKANSIAVFSENAGQSAEYSELEVAQRITERLRPTLEDYGFQLHRHQRLYPDAKQGEASDAEPTTIFDYYQVSSKDLLIDEWSAQQMNESLKGLDHYRSMTYLANSITKIAPLEGEMVRSSSSRRRMEPSFDFSPESVEQSSKLTNIGRIVPYSIVVGVELDSNDLVLDRYSDYSPRDLRAPYCWVNSWLAQELDLQAGDWIRMQYFDPETVDGELRESFVSLMVIGVVPVEQPERPFRRNRSALFASPPTRFNDPDLTPTVPGITNQESISNWDVPFELKLRDQILPRDDEYWEFHRLTPKVIMPFAYARNFFYSRFGVTTAIQIPVDQNTSEAEIRHRVESGLMGTRDSSGFVFRPIRYQHLTAASGTTPFDMLFLSLSMFVILSALLLVALLFRLGFQKRATQLGIFFSQGFTLPQVRRMIMQEMSVVVAIGGLIGIPLGLGYAWLLITGLETWWIGAIQSRFLQFFFTPRSLLIGLVAGAIACLLAIFLSFVSVSRLQPLKLLRGDNDDSLPVAGATSRAGYGLAGVSFVIAILLGFFAVGQLGMIRAACFFGSGMLLLVSSLCAANLWLKRPKAGADPVRQRLGSLALRSIVRNPLRSTLSIGLLSVATFLVASMSVFQTNPNELGYGGFDLIGTSNQPIFDNLGSPRARKQAIGVAADQILGSTIIPIRMSEGDDASCNNLYQVERPTVLGVSEKLHKLSDLTDSYKFAWAAAQEPKSPWQAIHYAATGDRGMPIPVILDQNTALWSLKQGGSLHSLIRFEIEGRETYFQVVGLLSNSVLQGKLIISESNFERLFPKISGYRYFLIKSGDSIDSTKVAGILEKGWSDAGLDVVGSRDILQKLLSVQNTYISAFQSLGALGLLLGTVGLIAVQLRSILERKRELALMQAVGFSRSRLVHLLSLETIILLGGGLCLGLVCSAIALVPYIAETGPQLGVVQPLAMLLAILVCGFVAAGITAKAALRLPLLSSLRSE